MQVIELHDGMRHGIQQYTRLEQVEQIIAAMLWVADPDPRDFQNGNVLGFPQHLILMIRLHADACSFPLQQYHSSSFALSVALLQILISQFRCLVHSTGFKPMPNAALGKLRAADSVASFRTIPGLKVHLCSYRAARYMYDHSQCAASAVHW